VHCDTTCNIFNGDQIAGGFGIPDARHKLHPTSVFITKAKGLVTDKYKKIMRMMDVNAAIVCAELNIEAKAGVAVGQGSSERVQELDPVLDALDNTRAA